MAGVYLDASVVLRKLFRHPGAIRDWSSWDYQLASELLQVEALRTLDRLRITRAIGPEQLVQFTDDLKLLLSGIEKAPISPQVLRRASAPFPTPLGALDAIHLSTALVWVESTGDELIVLTHDRQLATAAVACGLEAKT